MRRRLRKECEGRKRIDASTRKSWPSMKRKDSIVPRNSAIKRKMPVARMKRIVVTSGRIDIVDRNTKAHLIIQITPPMKLRRVCPGPKSDTPLNTMMTRMKIIKLGNPSIIVGARTRMNLTSVIMASVLVSMKELIMASTANLPQQ